MRAWTLILPVFLYKWIALRRLGDWPAGSARVVVPHPEIWIRSDGGPQWWREQDRRSALGRLIDSAFERKIKIPRIHITWE